MMHARGFTQSLKFALGGPNSDFMLTRTSGIDPYSDFRHSPRRAERKGEF